MQISCKFDGCVPNLQVPNVPTELYRTLKAKAALEGTSLSAFLLAELEKFAKRPTRRELRQRLLLSIQLSCASVARRLSENRPKSLVCKLLIYKGLSFKKL